MKARIQPESVTHFSNPAFSLFEMLISLTLVAIILMLLITAETQTVKIWRDLEEDEELMNEGLTLMQMISHDLRSASQSSPIKLREKSELFFLKRTPSNELVAVGYVIDPNKKNLCRRFCAKPKETLTAMSDKNLAELESSALAGEVHSETIARHLLSLEVTPILDKEEKIILLEINSSFANKSSRYFLSTVVAVQK